MKILNWVEYDLSLLKVSKCVKDNLHASFRQYK